MPSEKRPFQSKFEPTQQKIRRSIFNIMANFEGRHTDYSIEDISKDVSSRFKIPYDDVYKIAVNCLISRIRSGEADFCTSEIPQDMMKSLHEDFEHGIGARKGLYGTFGDEEKTKNYFANNGIINSELNNSMKSFKLYITTCFLANRRLALKLGCNWGTASRKKVFNAYTVDSNSILVIINDIKNGKIIQAQCSKDGIVMACDEKNSIVNDERYDNIVRKMVLGEFDLALQKTKEMCAQEDEFFANKTSKTYEKLRESKTNKKKNAVKINENTIKQMVAESVKRVLNEMETPTPYGSMTSGEWKPTFDDPSQQRQLASDTIDMLSKIPQERFVKLYWNRRLTFKDPDTVDAIYKEAIKRGIL
jgi:ribosomal protein S21